MKSNFAVLALFVTLAFNSNCFAQAAGAGSGSSAVTAPALPASLQETMKAMNKTLKQIILQSADSSKDQLSAMLSEQFANLVLNAKKFMPDSIAKMPADQQAAAAAQYGQILDQVSATGMALSKAFLASDTTKIQQLLATLNDLKKQGHGTFDN